MNLWKNIMECVVQGYESKRVWNAIASPVHYLLQASIQHNRELF